MNTHVESLTEHHPISAWLDTATAQRARARDVAQLIADTLAAQFPGAAYLTLWLDEDTPRGWELFTNAVRDDSGAALFDFDEDLPALGPEHAELARRWGNRDYRNGFTLRAVLRELYIAGAVFDRLPEDLEEELDEFGEDDEVLCLLLSSEARPREWQHEGPDDWGVEARRLRPYSAADPRRASVAAGTR
ncbi:hypothetical protein ACFC58_06255 [Kitasatospora purpeofusca]|uniref:hypothetical protein n=1 Tax=Kitasatospora purpeofusca TaxID=67352 RepID=UPI0035D9DCFA